MNKRQNELLKQIIEEHIKTAHPISSKSLCEALDCSSATIRNEMGILEELGYIEKTHTSSGRIPSEKGYRYYVDYIMKPKEITGEDMLRLQTLFQNQTLAISDVIKESMEIIAELTHYTSIVLGSSSKENRVSKVEAIPINEQKMVALIITDQGHVEKKDISYGPNISLEEIRQTVELINRLIVGTPIDEVAAKLEFEVKPIIGKYVKQHELLYNAFYHVFEDFTKEKNVQFSGTSHILKQPEFDDVDKIREIISKFDDKEIVESINEEADGIRIYIGSENEFDRDVTIVKTKYQYHGEEGTIAIMGPKRMEYDRVIALLDYIKNHIS